MITDIARKLFRLMIRTVFSSDPNRIKQVKIDGRHQLVWIAEHVGRKIALKVFERSETAFLEATVKEGDVCVDVGANVGYFTHLFAQRVGESGRVVAVEPIKRNAKLIEVNSVINGTDGHVTVINKAVSESESGSTSFSLRNDSASSSITEEENTPERDNPLNTSTTRIEVLCDPLDTIITDQGLSKIDVLKMDIEGYEYRALLGMGKVLSSDTLRPNTMMIELFSKHLECFNNSIRQVVDYLQEYGYAARFIDKTGSLSDFTSAHYDVEYNVIFVNTRK